jgi:hypothetical protein
MTCVQNFAARSSDWVFDDQMPCEHFRPTPAPAKKFVAKGDCQYFCVRPVIRHEFETLVEHDGELRLRLGPLARRSFSFRSGVVLDQI